LNSLNYTTPKYGTRFNSEWLTLFHAGLYLEKGPELLAYVQKFQGRPSFKVQFPNLKDSAFKK
jgi:hypothetical protein